jgi:hypothetical protein
MAGSQTFRLRGARFAAALALSLFTFAGRARALDPSPPVPPAGMPAQNFSAIVDAVSTPDPPAEPMTVPQPSYDAGPGVAPAGAPVVMGLFSTLTASLFGKPDPNTWRPLPIWTFFTEGWNEA